MLCEVLQEGKKYGKKHIMFWQKKPVIAACPLTILVLFVFGRYHDLFHTASDYDVLMHFLGGGFFVITFAGILWHLPWGRRLLRRASPAGFRVGLVAGLVLTSITWEILEVVLNMTPNITQSVPDTVFDMVCALGGAALALCFIRPDD